MTEKAQVWLFTRARLAGAHEGLTDEQMAYRPFDGAHNIFEYLYHIAGAEHYWATRMTGRDPAATTVDAMFDAAVKDNFLRDEQFPFGPDWYTRGQVENALHRTYQDLLPVISNPTPEQLAMPLISPIGDSIDGAEGLTRVAQHAGYHTGQIWLIRQMPGFPAGD